MNTNQTLTRKARHQRRLLQQFVSKWRRDYLLSLCEHHRVKLHQEHNSDISVGDIVILQNDSSSRNFWKLAKIEELIPGRDGVIRSAVVKVSSNSRRPVLLKRVIQQLIPIEVRSDNDANLDTIMEENESGVVNELNHRPRRTAAVLGETRRRTLNVK